MQLPSFRIRLLGQTWLIRRRRDQPAALDLAVRAWQKAKTSRAHNAVADSFPQLSTILQGHTGTVHSAVSHDGQRILTASNDNTARVFRVITLSEIC